MALRVHRHQAKASRKRFILGHGDALGRHVLGQTAAFLLAIGHHRRLHLTVELLLRPLGGPDKAIQASEFEDQTHEANATRPDFRAHQMEPNHQAMQAGQPRGTLKKGDDSGLFVEALLIELPGSKGRSGNLKSWGGLTLRLALGS